MRIGLALFWLAMFIPIFSYAQDKPSEKTENFLLGSFRSDHKAEKQPVYIKSNTLRVNSQSRVFTYDGEVEVIQGDMQITAERMTGTYDKDQNLERITCEEQVVITKGTGLRASSNRAVFLVKEEVIEMTEAPEVYRDGNVLSADLVKIFVAEDRSEAEGNVRVKVINTGEESPNQSLFSPAEKEEPADPVDDGRAGTEQVGGAL